jgi:hypothetical protein
LLKYDAEAQVCEKSFMRNNRFIFFFFQRFQFSDDKVPWNVDFPDYKPTEYTTTKIQRNPKADPMDP